MKGKGLGSVVNAAITARLKKRFPDYLIRHEAYIDDRTTQLTKRFRIEEPYKPMSISEYYKRNRDYLRKMFKRFPPRKK